MQHEVTRRQPLLDIRGHIAEPGWARHLVWQYNRENIKRNKLRIKEWDYYLVQNEEFGMAFTLSDMGYVSMMSVSFLDFVNNSYITKSEMKPLSLGRVGLSKDSSEDNVVDMKTKKMHLRYTVKSGKRRIQCTFKKFDGMNDLKADIMLDNAPEESMCIATPWKEKPTAFYYNQKINCMRARGGCTIGNKSYRYDPDTDFGILDWGRGTWTYDNTWFWGIGNTWYEGKPLGFNLGYGFSDRSSASENVIVYDGKIHKLEDVWFDIPTYDNGDRIFMDPWQITSSDGRFEMDFIPMFDRRDYINLGPVRSDQHQIFGRMSGTMILDDGKKIEIHDLICGVEVIHNKY